MWCEHTAAASPSQHLHMNTLPTYWCTQNNVMEIHLYHVSGWGVANGKQFSFNLPPHLCNSHSPTEPAKVENDEENSHHIHSLFIQFSLGGNKNDLHLVECSFGSLDFYNSLKQIVVCQGEDVLIWGEHWTSPIGFFSCIRWPGDNMYIIIVVSAGRCVCA